MQFVTHEISGADGMVRGLFLSRSLAAPPASSAYFPGIEAVAILPKQFDSAAEAIPWVKTMAQPRRQRDRGANRAYALADRRLGRRHFGIRVIALHLPPVDLDP